ncbi:hypothetical protein F5144DRAFT_333662 [Chaetomium tenue]|uniref:Uncharacterized protein n=1 Tax=Chaetomium tenue TaxID=1854479 RepID=A0ACB7NWD6_9PEZI|nr:hypothetical protein F5144DRAFT_333662 [Chaetomium globosum]
MQSIPLEIEMETLHSRSMPSMDSIANVSTTPWSEKKGPQRRGISSCQVDVHGDIDLSCWKRPARAHPWHISRTLDSSRSMGDPPRRRDWLADANPGSVGGAMASMGTQSELAPQKPPLVRYTVDPSTVVTSGPPGCEWVGCVPGTTPEPPEPCLPKIPTHPLDWVCSLHLDLKSSAVRPPSSTLASIRQLGVPSPTACQSLAVPTG